MAFEKYEIAMKPRQRSEPALTKAVGELLAQDSEAAGRFAATVVALLRPPEARRIPSRLSCEAEVPFALGMVGGNRGREIDLVFRDRRGGYVLLIEAKLDAKLMRKQLKDDLRVKPQRLGAAPEARMHVAVIGNRALAPKDKTKSDKWLGATTWGNLLDEVHGLQFEDAQMTQRWTALLDKYQEIGAFRPARIVTDGPFELLNRSASSLVREVDSSLRRRGVSAQPIGWSANSELVVYNGSSGPNMRIRLASGPIKKEVIRLGVRAKPGAPAVYSVVVSREVKGDPILVRAGEVSRDPDQFRKDVVALIKAATTLGSR